MQAADNSTSLNYLTMMNNSTYLIAGSRDSVLMFWNIDFTYNNSGVIYPNIAY